MESGWGSILPTVVIANLMHGGPAERSGELSIGDRLMSVNGTSLVGLPLHTCQSIIRVSQGCGHRPPRQSQGPAREHLGCQGPRCSRCGVVGDRRLWGAMCVLWAREEGA